ncbi:MAG: RNA 2',3'-cyclic phosphodiesterase [Thermoplasmata archaeon]|nr:RNA 2',3'-cyclic phosphodiesterase [Thermoplasmata archaeon]
MRTFVAIEVGDLSTSEHASHPTRAPAHLTLRFLGEIDATRASEVAGAVGAAVASERPFDLTLEGVGAFPSSVSPRVVWVGVTEGREAVVRIAHRVAVALSAVGFPPEAQEFVPHVTWFRVRSGRDRERARRLLEGTDPPPSVRSVRVTEVVVKESLLAPGGVTHRTLRRLPLSGIERAEG